MFGLKVSFLFKKKVQLRVYGTGWEEAGNILFNNTKKSNPWPQPAGYGENYHPWIRTQNIWTAHPREPLRRRKHWEVPQSLTSGWAQHMFCRLCACWWFSPQPALSTATCMIPVRSGWIPGARASTFSVPMVRS